MAGIRPGDVIVRIDGAIVDSPNKLSRLIGTLTPGAQAKIDVIRDLKHVTLTILHGTPRRGSRTHGSSRTSRSKLGVEVQELTPSLAEKFKLRETKGVMIMRVESNSLAHAEGLREGDLIKEVNRTETLRSPTIVQPFPDHDVATRSCSVYSVKHAHSMSS
ncbi:MAG: PDZ domain-containing protein [Nitrospira sp.]|nr:PDZ domain-containing protein [Nitrospira sp.]